jgi:hypothetical protein
MSPSRDYPASHSMDTCWFAVDEAGQVAAFETGEPGHVPAGEGNDVLDELYQLLCGANPMDAEGWVEWNEHARALGVYCFSYPDDYGILAVPYERAAIPPLPLHIDQLPGHLRDRCREVCFATLRFDQCEVIQPVEFLRCVFYEGEMIGGYLASDGRTVRPVPGKEARFAEWAREFREEDPEQAARVVFDPPVR